MKKFLAMAVVVVMVLALAVSASANLNIDRIHVNANSLDAAPDVKADDPQGDQLDPGHRLLFGLGGP